VFLRSQIRPVDDEEHCALMFDIGFHSPESERRYFSRAARADLVEALSAFFLQAASDWDPELSVSAVVDPLMGLEVAVTSSTPSSVGLLVSLASDGAQDSDEPDGLDFETTRAALAQAAQDIRDLTSVDQAAGGITEPPEIWI